MSGSGINNPENDVTHTSFKHEGLNLREINTAHKDVSEKDLSDKSVLQDFFYTEPEDAIREIETRRSESGFTITDIYPDAYEVDKQSSGKILAFIYRDISPNLEIARMIDTCDFIGLHPILFYHNNDIFSCLSRSKYLLGKMGFFSGYGRSGGMKLDFTKIIDFNGAEGKKINEVKTIFGNDLATFHKEIFNEKYHFLERSEFDIVELLKTTSTIEVYKFIFFLSVKNGFLLENFVFQDLEKEFISSVIVPAFKFVWETTGYKPLIVPFEPTDSDDADFWHYYYFNIKDIIEDKYKVTLK